MINLSKIFVKFFFRGVIHVLQRHVFIGEGSIGKAEARKRNVGVIGRRMR